MYERTSLSGDGAIAEIPASQIPQRSRHRGPSRSLSTCLASSRVAIKLSKVDLEGVRAGAGSASPSEQGCTHAIAVCLGQADLVGLESRKNFKNTAGHRKPSAHHAIRAAQNFRRTWPMA